MAARTSAMTNARRMEARPAYRLLCSVANRPTARRTDGAFGEPRTKIGRQTTPTTRRSSRLKREGGAVGFSMPSNKTYQRVSLQLKRFNEYKSCVLDVVSIR